MGSLTDAGEKLILDHLLKTLEYAPSPEVFLLLSSTDPLDDGSGITEPIGGSYSRTPISFASAVGRSITQSANVVFPIPTAPWGTMNYFAIADNVVAGNILAYGSLGASKDIITDNSVIVVAGDVTLTMLPGGMCSEYVRRTFNWMFRDIAMAQPTNLYIALTSAAIIDDDTGVSIIDLIMTGYIRQLNNTWTPAVGALASSDNDVAIIFPSLTDVPETILGTAVVDHETDGEILFYSNAINAPVAVGNAPTFPIGDFNITLD